MPTFPPALSAPFPVDGIVALVMGLDPASRDGRFAVDRYCSGPSFGAPGVSVRERGKGDVWGPAACDGLRGPGGETCGVGGSAGQRTRPTPLTRPVIPTGRMLTGLPVRGESIIIPPPTYMPTWYTGDP